MPGVLGGGTPLGTLLGDSLAFPPPVTPLLVLMEPFEGPVARVPNTAVLLGPGFGIVGFGELMAANWVRACPLPPIPMSVPILVPEPDVAVVLGLAMVAIEPELDEVVGRAIPKCPDTDRDVAVGGDRGVAFVATLVADTVEARARRGCFKPDIVDVVDFVADIDVDDGNFVVAAPDPTLLPEPLGMPVPTLAPVSTAACSTFTPSCFTLVVASRLSPPEAGGLILLLLVPLVVPVTLAILLIPLPPIVVAMLPLTTVRGTVSGAGNAPPFVVDGIWIIETGRCFGAPIPVPLVAVLLPADVPAAPAVVESFISFTVLVSFWGDRVRSSAFGCKEGVEEDMVPASFLLLGGGDWMVLLKVSVIHL